MSAGAAPIPWPTWRLAILVALGALMTGLDASVVAVGLDRIARDLDADLVDAQWIATAYLLALGVGLPACGWLARRLGAGRVWLGAMAGFTVASALCALAIDVWSLVAMRALQGLAAGLLIPAGQTVLGQAVGPSRLGRVMATLGIMVALGPALGPVVGGLVLEVAAWPWLFALNLPIGVAALLAGRRLVPRGAADPEQRPDLPGLALLTLGLPLVVLAATTAGEQRSAAGIGVLLPLVAGAAALAAFAARARRLRRAPAGRPRPALDLGLLALPRFAAAGATSALGGAAMLGAALVLPLYFQLGRGADPAQAGVAMLGLGLGTTAALPHVGRWVDRVGGGPVSALGAAALVATTIPFALLDLDAPWWAVQLLLVARGVATALAIVPTTVAAYRAVAVDQLPDATALVNVLQRLGGALGGALLTIVLATGLAGGAEAAIHRTAWWLAATSALGLLAALWLWRAERAGRTAVDAAPLPGAAA